MLLLDTHTYLWFLEENETLPTWVINKIQISEKVFVSIASFWEISIKNAKGSLQLPCSISEMMSDCASLNISILPIYGSHLDKLKKLPYIHKNPFDRLIICQAQAEDMSIVTADSFIIQYDVNTIHFNKIMS